MIINIDLKICTRCGICDPVCPADAIHCDDAGAPEIRCIEHCITVG